MREYRWARISMVFQAAMNSLDPVYRVGEQIIEALEHHVESSPAASLERVRELYDLVNLDTVFIPRYPHEYSGGMKQRAIIAMALACEPDMIIADEPTTALDVIVQDRILREMKKVQRELDMGMIYISHDMAVIAEVSDTVGVMYAGKIVEFGDTYEVFNNPIHPYTRALMSAFPSVSGEKRELSTLDGEPPNLLDPPPGCRFHPALPLRHRRMYHDCAPRRPHRRPLGILLEPPDNSPSDCDTKMIPNTHHTQQPANETPLLKAEGLTKLFPVSSPMNMGNWFRRARSFVHAVDGVRFELGRGDSLGLVGESGCGKTTTGRLLVRLSEPTDGHIIFDDGEGEPHGHRHAHGQVAQGVQEEGADDIPGPLTSP